ncbi:hypothetical protein FHG87_007213 [Trinorchestia longiramus]|nr:hypothetical protein FHG87_007213 [Trinorchestia longiramus]
MFRWAKSSFRSKRKGESSKKEKQSLAVEKKKSVNIFTACTKSKALEPPYEKSGGTTPDSNKVRGSKDSEDCSLRKRTPGSHATAERTQSLLVPSDPERSGASAARGKSDTRSMSELRGADNKQNGHNVQETDNKQSSSVDTTTEKSEVGVNESVISESKKLSFSKLPMNNCNGLKNDAQKQADKKGEQLDATKSSELKKTSNDVQEATLLIATNELNGNVGGNMRVKQPGKGGCDAPPPNEVMEKSRVGSVTRDDLPCDRLHPSVSGGQGSENSGGRSPSATVVSPPSGDQKLFSAADKNSEVPLVVEESSVAIVKSLQKNLNSSSSVPKDSITPGTFSSTPAAICETTASKNYAEKSISEKVVQHKKIPLSAEAEQKHADALSSVLPDILSEIEEHIIACSDLSDSSVLSHKTVLHEETDHGGKVIYKIGGATGKEINVTFDEDFNKEGELQEVVEKPIVKKHFVPLTSDDASKTDSDVKLKKNFSSTTKNTLGVEKTSVLDRISSDIVDSKVVQEPLSKEVLNVSKSKDGSIIREIGGPSGKEVNIRFQSANINKQGEKSAVDEDVIIKERFSPLGTEKKIVLDNLQFREKSVIESAVKRRFKKYTDTPSQEQKGSESIPLTKSEKELVAADLKEDLDPFWSELDSSLASAIACAGHYPKASPPTQPVTDEVIGQEPVDHVRRAPKDTFDREPTHQPLHNSAAQVLRALDSLKKASSENVYKGSFVTQVSSVSQEIPTTKHSLSQSAPVPDTTLGKKNFSSFVGANLTQDPEFSNKGHCSTNSEPLAVSTSSSSVSAVANSDSTSCTKVLLSPSTSTCDPNTSVTSTSSPTTSPKASTFDPATAESLTPSCDCDMNGQLARTGRHRDKCVRFSSLDFSPHSRSVDCYPIKEEPSSPLRTAPVAKPSLPKVLSKCSEIRATLAEEEEFDDIEISDERSSPDSDAHKKKIAEELETSSVPKSPTERNTAVGRRFRSEKNGLVANIIENFESAPLQGGSVDGGALRSPKNSSPLRQKEEFGFIREHNKVTYTSSKDYDGSKILKTETIRETSPKPDKPFRDYKWIKHVENKEKKETSPKSKKMQFDYKWIKPIEKVEKQINSPVEECQKIKIEAIQERTEPETRVDQEKNIKEEKYVPPIQITVTEASPEKKITVLMNDDHDILVSAVENISDSQDTEHVVVESDDVQILTDVEMRKTKTSEDESSNTNMPEASTLIEESPETEYSGANTTLPEISTEISESGSDALVTDTSTSDAAPKLDSSGVSPKLIPTSEEAVTDDAKNVEIVEITDETTNEEPQKVPESGINSDSAAAIEPKMPNGFTVHGKVDEDSSSHISERSGAHESDEVKISPSGTEPEAEVKLPQVVQPSTEFYLNPCKELLASSSSNAETKASPNKVLNPFGDSEDDSEETFTVRLNSSKSPLRTPTKSLNPFDEEDEVEYDKLNKNGESPSTGVGSHCTSTPSPLPRTTVPPVPTPRASKQGIGGSNLSLHSLDPRNLSENWPYTLKSPLNVSTLSTKSLNPFDESEEEEESRGAFQRHHMSNLSVRGDVKVNMIERGKHRGSLPIRRKKRRAPLPPGMQAPSPSPAHGPLTSSPSTPVGLFRSAASSLQRSPVYGTHRNGRLDQSSVHEAQENRDLYQSPVFGRRKTLSGARSGGNSPSTSTNGLGVPVTGFRRSTWGSSPRKVPPPRPPPPTLGMEQEEEKEEEKEQGEKRERERKKRKGEGKEEGRGKVEG